MCNPDISARSASGRSPLLRWRRACSLTVNACACPLRGALIRSVRVLLLLVLATLSERKRAEPVSQDEERDFCRKRGVKLRSRLQIQDLSC